MSICLFDKPNVTFVHIPKTAGTSMLDWLTRNCKSNNYKKWDIHPKHSDVKIHMPNNISFAVVRNPWDRMVSMYHYFKNIAINEGSRFLALNNLTADNFPDFDTWINNLDNFKVPEPYWFNASTPQIAWLDVPVDIVLRYEHLDEDFMKIQELFSCNEMLPHIYFSGRTHYASYYTNHTRKIVENIATDDINAWGYTFE